jgi:hypothetical protein
MTDVNLGYLAKRRTGFIKWKDHRPYQTINWEGYSKATKSYKKGASFP